MLARLSAEPYPYLQLGVQRLHVGMVFRTATATAFLEESGSLVQHSTFFTLQFSANAQCCACRLRHGCSSAPYTARNAALPKLLTAPVKSKRTFSSERAQCQKLCTTLSGLIAHLFRCPISGSACFSGAVAEAAL